MPGIHVLFDVKGRGWRGLQTSLRSLQKQTTMPGHDERETEMRDRFTFAAPLSVLGDIAEQLFLKRYMDRFLRHRNEIVRQVAESDRWQDFLPRSK